MSFDTKQAKDIGTKQGVVWDKSKFHPEDLVKGMEVETEHKDVTGGDPTKTAMIALAHLKERPDYYEKLEKMENSPITNRGRSETDSPVVGQEKKVGEH